ncbi:hypothetical protein [Maribacter cobaltidurans]|uniref:Uncharacterized protein n=1 Tax=Maribacter cobaltidurans TaxID=1178778 RepID=A0A223V3H5_9FLAO|nr:hypothetical protein [Maribacter cobaltidurans]ASV29882.1 hypothetical protein CJ263_06410 [Maribacter cobaltidurans]GGD88961.1 hypothetical protein GCM10011412_28590 [Maribacter cobaltidurans]
MKKYLFIVFLILITSGASAQFIKEKSVNALIGYGLSYPNNSLGDIYNDGLYLQGELVLKAASWVSFRPYAGFIFTGNQGKDFNGEPTDESASSKALLLGGKARLRGPIPWVAPYLELGVGTSIGSFRTMTYFDDFDKTGVIYHMPLSFGLELGKHHNVDLGFTYYYQPNVEQMVGAFAVGLNIPLRS